MYIINKAIKSYYQLQIVELFLNNTKYQVVFKYDFYCKQILDMRIEYFSYFFLLFLESNINI